MESASDLISLTKPRIVILVLFTSLAGVLLAPGHLHLPDTLLFLGSMAGIAGACNSLNMVIERDRDARMSRTMTRPIPSGRLRVRTALVFGILLLSLSFPLLHRSTNLLTTLLGALAAALYLGAYTPLKPRSPAALYVGAVSGAIPALMGTTAGTNTIGANGLALFGILYAWQLQHFLNIAIRYEEEYRRAGFRVYPVVEGKEAARRRIQWFCVALWIAALSPLWVGETGILYLLAACGLSFYLLTLSVTRAGGLHSSGADRRQFLAGLLALPLLLITLVTDIVLIKSDWPW